jgi:aminoglycoside 3-N-acetyltransferase
MTGNKYTVDDLVRGIKGLDIKRGDTVLVRAALRAIGDIDQNQKRSIALLQALLDVVGAEGTIVGLAFNRPSLFPKKNENSIITAQTPPMNGGLAIEMVNWPGAMRSQHPTNSFVAIGRLAGELVMGHDETATCFHPMKKIIEYDGKLILVGCVRSSPGFSTTDFALEELGFATRSISSGWQGVYYERDHEVRLFKRKDVPGCSRGFYKMYSHYVREGKLRTGFVGDAYSVTINARDAFEIDTRILKENPKYTLCDRPDCFCCRGSRLYNKSDMPKYYISQAIPILRFLWTEVISRGKSRRIDK